MPSDLPALALAPAPKTSSAGDSGRVPGRPPRRLGVRPSLLAAVAAALGAIPCPASALEGVVLRGGKPVARQYVSLRSYTDPPAPASTVIETDARGRFAFPLPAGTWRCASMYTAEGSAMRLLAPRESGPVRLELKPPGSLRIRVVNAAGAAIDSAEVRVFEAVQEYELILRGLTAPVVNSLGSSASGPESLLNPGTNEARPISPGAFLAKALPAGLWRMEVRAPGFAPLDRLEQVIPGQERAVDVVLASAVAVEGRVTNERGEPIENAPVVFSRGGANRLERRALSAARDPEDLSELLSLQVRILSSSERLPSTDAQGRFRLEHCAPGSGTLQIAAGDYFPWESTVSAPASGLSIQLMPRAFLRLRVNDSSKKLLPAKVRAEPSASCTRRAAAEVRPVADASATSETTRSHRNRINPLSRALPENPAIRVRRPFARLEYLVVGPLEACPYQLRIEASGFVPVEYSLTPDPDKTIDLEAVLTAKP